MAVHRESPKYRQRRFVSSYYIDAKSNWKRKAVIIEIGPTGLTTACPKKFAFIIFGRTLKIIMHLQLNFLNCIVVGSDSVRDVAQEWLAVKAGK